jgi:AraC-like DNA-binding protein
MTDKELIEKYREIIRLYAKDGIIDIDKRLRHKFNFLIRRLEDIIGELGGIVPPSRQSQYCITFIRKGTGQKSIGQFIFPLEKNLLFVIPKRVIHSTKYKTLTCSGYMLMFNIDFFLNNAFPKKHILNKQIFKNSIRPFLTLSDSQTKAVETLFEYILSEHSSRHMNKSEMIAVKILELLIRCDRFFSDAQAVGNEIIYNPLIEEFNNLVDKYFTAQRSVGFYADRLHVHPNHLNFMVKKYNGLSAKQMIDNKIIQEAKYLLSASAHNIKELSHQLGFENSAYFSSFFRRGAGCSPVEYRDSVV